VKAPLSAANLADSSAVRLARDDARSSSASKMMSFFLDAASPAAVRGEAMAETGLRREWDDDDDDKGLQGRDRRSGTGTLDAGEDRRGLTEERDVDAAAAEAMAERDMVPAAWKLEMERGFGGVGGERDGRLGKGRHFVVVEIMMDGRIVRAGFLLAFPRGRNPLVLSPKRKAARTRANFVFFRKTRPI
jgi:hypothetical protein